MIIIKFTSYLLYNLFNIQLYYFTRHKYLLTRVSINDCFKGTMKGTTTIYFFQILYQVREHTHSPTHTYICVHMSFDSPPIYVFNFRLVNSQNIVKRKKLKCQINSVVLLLSRCLIRLYLILCYSTVTKNTLH